MGFDYIDHDAKTQRRKRARKMEPFRWFLIRERVSFTDLERASLVSRQTLNRWFKGDCEPREDSVELIVEALSDLLAKELTAKDVGLA
ncbi:MAG: helix-turn-helix domain-containing protein [Lentisphaeraceae bacterium]|nr:helix-turn-helix domain-containing protein [Lentisphaeraceae bacterium]